ncbi:MAG: hypothetical protein Q8930_16955 [Bacillota bacterium]|nr:hypothetical protein [Bacillota bacterium]
MKKIILFFISSVLLLGIFIACSNTHNKQISGLTVNGQDIREIAFNQLTSNDKERLLGTWKEGKISKIILKEGTADINDKSYIGKEVYSIIFTTKEISRPNYIGVLLDKDNYKLIGYIIGD